MSLKRGTIDAVLWFWVVVLVVLIGAIAIVASGRGDSMSEVYDDRPDASLPMGRPLNADDLHSVRLNTGVRGYRMDEVDALLARLEAEMLEREERAEGAEPAEPASREEPAAGDGHTEPASRQEPTQPEYREEPAEPASRQEPTEPEYREEQASDFPSEPHADHDQFRNP